MALVHLHGNAGRHHVLIELECEVDFDKIDGSDIQIGLVKSKMNNPLVLVLHENQEAIVRQRVEARAAVELDLQVRLVNRIVHCLAGLDGFLVVDGVAVDAFI